MPRKRKQKAAYHAPPPVLPEHLSDSAMGRKIIAYGKARDIITKAQGQQQEMVVWLYVHGVRVGAIAKHMRYSTTRHVYRHLAEWAALVSDQTPDQKPVPTGPFEWVPDGPPKS